MRVIDKENGGRGDAVNAGVNIAHYPWVCRVDADSILQRDSLMLIVEPLLEDATVVASGGTIRVANGCKSRDGLFVEAGLPRKPLVLFQVIEYLRAFLYGRMGWSAMNAHMIISGAFGIYHKETFIAAGGYRSDTVGEDMELIVRLHRTLSAQRKRYRITFVPEPICWSIVPEDVGTLRRQRTRWQVGLVESMTMNRGLMFHKEGSFAGWFAFPFCVLRMVRAGDRELRLHLRHRRLRARRRLATGLPHLHAARRGLRRAALDLRAAARGDLVPPLPEAAPASRAVRVRGAGEFRVPATQHALEDGGRIPASASRYARPARRAQA
jgi:glycosyltransferase involved in cell wall biosynthesis